MATSRQMRELNTAEREDVTAMLSSFLYATTWADDPDDELFSPGSARNRGNYPMARRLGNPEALASYRANVEDLRRKRALAKRLGGVDQNEVRREEAAARLAERKAREGSAA